MDLVRNVTTVLRLAGAWFLLLCVVASAAPLGDAWAAIDGSKPCGSACPCDDAQQAEAHAEADPCVGDDSDGADHDGADPCEDQCPDDCPNCSCGVGALVAVMAMSLPSTRLASSSVRLLAPFEEPASGAGEGVFRPPRS